MRALAIATVAILAGCGTSAGSQFAPDASQSASSASRSHVVSGTRGALGPVLTAAASGTITGWDVDQSEGIGLLSAGYKNGTRLETFDLKTAKIIKMGSFQNGGSGSITRQYIVLRILANDVALVDDLNFHYQGFQRYDTFPTVSPIAKARVTGHWTPAHRKDLLVNPSEGWVAVNQDTSANLIMADRDIHRSKGGKLELIGSDVAKDTFMKPPRLTPHQVYQPPYLVMQDTAANEAIVPVQLYVNGLYNPFEAPSFDLYEQSSGKHSVVSPALGSGSVMGGAVDSTTHMMCTTTSEDSDVEFINLTTKTGFAENMPNGIGEGSGGGAVAVDELNHLFIVTQPAGSLLNTASIYVYNEKGNLLESISGFDFENASAAVFAYVAVNPQLRIGYVTTANAAQLQSFSY
ncbi:MAG: hypothetical protein JOZ77_03265 [Candidatus Eremiobacteraeota bacterium]|nr:hypothetical protein [Candidatus Eremiobacteraeota bacterium]